MSFHLYEDDGQNFSKIDKALVCHSFLSKWQSAKFIDLPRYRSDHKPLLLLCLDVYFGKPPLIFFNSWLKEDGLENIVHLAYQSVSPFHPPDKLLAKRLQAIKAAIEPWCVEVFKKNNGLLKEIAKKVEDLDLKAETVVLSDVDVKKRKIWLKTINEIDDSRMEDLKQRAKLKWVVDADENSSLFHGIIKGHQKNNRINGLIFNDVWVSQPDALKT
ncbi:uncharacterized protein LOC110899904 [Helianthus annuus]|uniref:uncharacterized protein LOC110899904 n=1 Tax=Helianthus annuus TaxID=4232 RepID=UPI000B901F09|nr:uncharacterized protein LOC110899904 [Helianthus annuus]